MKMIDIIRYEGDDGAFVVKHPAADFKTGSQLIVHEAQEALLFSDGRALDLFGPGRYTLYTSNIPMLNKILNIPPDEEAPIHCEIYFINKTEQMAMNWGVGNINFLDPTHNDYAFKIGASGEMSLRICDSRKVITKLVGTGTVLDQETMKKYFKGPIITHIKTFLPNILREEGISIFEVEAYLSGLSEILRRKLSEEMEQYGVSLEKFWINTILKPETDPFYITLNRQRGEKVTLVNQAELDLRRAEYERTLGLIDYSGEVRKQRMDIDTRRYEQEQLGFTYQQKEGFEVLKRIAENESGVGELGTLAGSIGMGVGAGGAFGKDPAGIAKAGINPVIAGPESGAKPDGAEDELTAFQKKLSKLLMMKEAGLLSEEEFAEQKLLLLDEIQED